jgi:AcrR family transcriptional regulator
LEAANQVVVADGVKRLTLEAVARRAGVSKGGLLYHFPNKQALIEGMIGNLGEVFVSRLAQELAADDAASDEGRWLRAYARATFAGEQESLTASSGFLAAVANNPELLKPLRENFGRWQELAESDGLDPALATVVRLAVEGLWFADLFGFAAPAEPLRTQVLNRILDLAGEAVGTGTNSRPIPTT